MEKTMEKCAGTMEETMEVTMGMTSNDHGGDHGDHGGHQKGLQGMTCRAQGGEKPRAEPWGRQRHNRRVKDDYMIILDAMPRSEAMMAMLRRTLKVDRPQL